ncbi:MAG: MGH1-like glycoside hydrolase domain-containing protein [Flavitalea sp.]
MDTEKNRLKENGWKRWGPYVSNRQWATVREDYSEDFNTWNFTSYEKAISRAYRWGEDGIGAICDEDQLVCFGIALWNKKDSFIKERLFGLTNPEGNHGEDVKELYYYLDSTPTHSYMKMLYKYPQHEFPYQNLREENARRNRFEAEYEIFDTGAFNDNKYFDVVIEYAKVDAEDLLIRIEVFNRANEAASMNIIPTVWFRNTWSWGEDSYKPQLSVIGKNHIKVSHRKLGKRVLYSQPPQSPIFCENETNSQIHYHKKKRGTFKDGINNYIVHGTQQAVNRRHVGTKAAWNYDVEIPANSSYVVKLRLGPDNLLEPFQNFDVVFNQRKEEADEFYHNIQHNIADEDTKLVQRQALAGMLWNKQFYYYDVNDWINGDAINPGNENRRYKRNSKWVHLHNADIISMPDKWEYPWYAAWDLAFHCVPLGIVDIEFAKEQLLLLTRERYMHPNGQLPAYEWDFSDVNPPVHAWATWRIFKMDKKADQKGDTVFLESMFHKLLVNFTWWVNRKDTAGNNIFQGGFLGLDNIGVFDRNTQLPGGGYIEQADGTSWMAMFSLNMLRISLELAKHNPVYQDMATKFFEHFMYIAGAMSHMGEDSRGLWDKDEEFFYDQVRLNDHETIRLKVRSMVGLIPLFAVEVLDESLLSPHKEFSERMHWFFRNRPDLSKLVSKYEERNEDEKHLLSLLKRNDLIKILRRMLDETEFLSDYGIRSLSKFHQDNPFEVSLNGENSSIHYTPGESINDMFGGNSNWRGPVWMPLNYMIIESLRKFHFYYRDSLKVECPTNSGNFMNLHEVALELSKRLTKLFTLNDEGERVANGDHHPIFKDEHFRDNIMFFEYFNGDNGKGLGASQQTGWTGLIAELIRKIAVMTKVSAEQVQHHEEHQGQQ